MLRYSPDALSSIDGRKLLGWSLMSLTSRHSRFVARQLCAMDTSDLRQHICLRILRNAPSGDHALSTIISNETRWSVSRICHLRTLLKHAGRMRPHVSLPELQGPDVDFDANLSTAEMRSAIRKALASLTYRRRLVIELRYGFVDGFEYTYSDIGKILNVTRERIRQMEAQAIQQLQHPLRSQRLRRLLPPRRDEL